MSRIILIIPILIFLSGCSLNLEQADKLSIPQTQEEFRQDCEKMAEKIRDNCPETGFDSWYFIYNFVWNREVKTISGIGGNCFNSESGAIESRKNNRQEIKYKNIIKTSSGKKEEVSSTNEFCQASCESFNCPEYEKDLEKFNLCEQGTSIYYPGPNSLSDEAYVKEQIVSSCARRGNTYASEEGMRKETKIKSCSVIDDTCGFINVTSNHSLMYCCCSCKRPERETIFWGNQELLSVLGKQEDVAKPKPVKGIESSPEIPEEPKVEEIVKEENIENAVCGDGIINGFEICDNNQFSEQCWESIRNYQEMYPHLVPRCFNNCKGCEAAPPDSRE